MGGGGGAIRRDPVTKGLQAPAIYTATGTNGLPALYMDYRHYIWATGANYGYRH